MLADPADYRPCSTSCGADGALATAPAGGWRARPSPPPPPTTPPSPPGSPTTQEPRRGGRRVRPPHLRREPLALRYGENPHQRAALYRYRRHRCGRRRAVVGDDDPARRPGAQLPQPLRRRRRLAARPRPGRPVRPARGGHHQARQPVRGGRRRHAGRRLPAGVRVRRALGVRRHRGPEPTGRRGHGRADGGRGAGRRRHRSRLRARHGRGAGGQAEEHPHPRGRAARARPWHLRPITGGLLVQDPHRFVADRSDWRVVTQRSRPRPRWTTPSWPGGCAAG